VSQTVNKRDFYRTKIGRTEKVIGGFILLLLIGIGFGIARKGHDFDQTRYTGDIEALEFTRNPVEGKAATLRNESDLRASESFVSGDKETGSSFLTILPPVDGLLPMGETEVYSVDTLYEKINGRAPAYFEYNFQELTSQSFSHQTAEGEFVDIYLFEMDSPLNAFGIFSAERDASSPPLNFVADGYNSGTGTFMRLGNVYVQVLASSFDPAIMQSAEFLTRRLVEELPEDDSGMEGRMLLPSENQVAGSLTYINENAYGQSVLKGVFEARYQANGEELTCFAQDSADAGIARGNWEALLDFYVRYGSLDDTFETGDANVFVAEVFGQWNVVYTRDNTVVGVVNAAGKEVAVAFVTALLEEDSETTDEYGY